MSQRSGSLIETINEYIDSEGLELPVLNDVAFRLQKLGADENFDVAEVERLIQSDQTLAAEVLRASNSPFFGGLSPVQSIRSAVVRLGISQVCRLVLLATERGKYQAKDPVLKEMAQELWSHTTAAAVGASWLARRLNYRKLEEEAFLGGLIHDIGKLVILRVLDELKARQDAGFPTSSDLVQEVLASAHPELGFNLLKRWNIPELFCRIARDHHREDVDSGDPLMLIVRLANLAANKVGYGMNHDATLVLAATPEAHGLGAGEVLLAELEIMLEDAAELSGV